MQSAFRLTRRTLSALLACTGTALAQSPHILAGISAGKVAVISDGDYIARTYADSVLAPSEAGHKDLLTILSIENGRVVQSRLSVSNSVTAAPEVLELAPDGRTAFVTERLGERLQGGRTVKDLPPGNRLFAIDLSEAANPKLAAIAEVGVNPEALAVSPDGRRVAVVSNTASQSLLQIVVFKDGKFGKVASFDLAEHGIQGQTSGSRGGLTATNVQWHPSGRFVAVNINTQNRIAFFELSVDQGAANIKPWGQPVETGRDPFVGRFTPDGRYYLTSNWGRDFKATTLDGRIPDAASTISLIKLASPDSEDPRHEHLLNVDTDISAEGIAISPDGRLVATINMRGTAFPEDSPRHTKDAGISLLTLDPETGKLEKVGDYPFEGVLPEGGTFDLTGDHLLATVFEGHPGAGSDRGAGVEVFRVIKGARPSLQRVGRLTPPHGAHHVDVAP